jgi:hypothetical protein
MNIKVVVGAVIAGMWILGLLLGQGTGKNYDNDPIPPQDRPYGNFNEYKYEYNDDDYEIEEGINTP